MKLKISGQDFFEEGFVGVGFIRVGVKWRVPGEQDVRNDPDAPNVSCRGAWLSCDHFRCEVAGSSADRGPLFELPLVFREPEIGDEYFRVFVVVVVEQVLELEVPVHDALLVHERNGAKKLNEKIGRLGLREGHLLDEPIENFATLKQKAGKRLIPGAQKWYYTKMSNTHRVEMKRQSKRYLTEVKI